MGMLGGEDDKEGTDGEGEGEDPQSSRGGGGVSQPGVLENIQQKGAQVHLLPWCRYLI